MLQIRVHDRDIGRGARKHSFDAGRCEAAAANTVHAAHASVVLRALAQHVLRAIEGIVDHEDDFPVHAAQRFVERRSERQHVFTLGVGGNNHGELRHWLTSQAAAEQLNAPPRTFARGRSPCPGDSMALMRCTAPPKPSLLASW